MHLTDEQIAKYQQIYKKYYGEKISAQEAQSQGIKLVQLMKLIYKPITREQYKQVQKRRQEINSKRSKKGAKRANTT